MPPRRDRTTPRPEGLNDPPNLDALDEAAEAAEIENIEETYTRLKGQVAESRKLREIQDMRRELDKLASGVESAGGKPASHKRGASSVSMPSPPTRLYIKPKTPPIYEGKNIRELQSYEVAWKVYLNAMATRENRMLEDCESITLAATFLRGPALDA
jgi:hypothetical protein